MKCILYIFLLAIQIQQPLIIFDFNTTENTNLWRIVNDDVMGGKSTSMMSLINKTGVFQGEVSLENNGGFAMTQLDCKLIGVNNFQKLVIDIKGDGRTYQFRIKENRYSRYSYVQNFKTSGKEETIVFYLKDFAPQFRGVKLGMANFEKDVIEQVAILIGDKKNEKFELQINKITLK